MTNPEQDLVLRRGLNLWLVDGIATILVALLLAATVNPVVGATVVLIGAVLALRRPTVALRTTGIGLNGVEIPWADVGSVKTVDGFRTRSVHVFVVSSQRWRPVAALLTSRTLPGGGYSAAVGQFERWVAEHAPSAGLVRHRWGPSWIWPAALAVVLAVPLSTQDPLHNWVPLPEATHLPASCDLARATADRLGVAATATVIDSPLMPASRACERRGGNSVLITQVEPYHRDGLRSGVGIAHSVYTQWSVDIADSPSGEPAPRPGPLPADEVSTTGYSPHFQEPVEGVYLVARRANVVVFIAYSPDHATVPALLTRTPQREHPQPGARRLNARPDDLAVATQVANEILSAVALP